MGIYLKKMMALVKNFQFSHPRLSLRGQMTRYLHFQRLILKICNQFLHSSLRSALHYINVLKDIMNISENNLNCPMHSCDFYIQILTCIFMERIYLIG